MTRFGISGGGSLKILLVFTLAFVASLVVVLPGTSTALAHPEGHVLPGDGFPNQPEERVVEGRGEFEMVLIHGLGGSNEIWQDIKPFLLGTFKVHLFELSGHGQTQPIMDTSILKETDRLKRFLKDNDIVTPTLVGHGIGGLIALQYSLDNPSEVHRLILLDAAPKQMASVEQKQHTAEQLATDYDRFVASRYLHMGPQKEVTEKVLDIALRTDQASFTSLLMSSFDFDVTKELAGQAVPLLVVGSELLFPTPDSCRDILNQIGFGTARVLSFKRMGRTGHYMMLERTVFLASVLMSFGVTAEYRFEAGY